MADEKKPDKAKGGSNDRKALEQVIFLLVGLFFLAALITGILNYIEILGSGTVDSIWGKISDYFFGHIWPTWTLGAAIVSTLALIGIVYNSWKLRAINIVEQKIYNPVLEMPTGDEREVIKAKSEKWEKVMKYLNSDNISDWRLAIIEADVMLEEMLRRAGYTGESIGEMLKSVDKSDFFTLDDAWGAHKIRNVIAHSGADFQLSEREARRTVSLFEKVLK